MLKFIYALLDVFKWLCRIKGASDHGLDKAGLNNGTYSK